MYNKRGPVLFGHNSNINTLFLNLVSYFIVCFPETQKITKNPNYTEGRTHGKVYID